MASDGNTATPVAPVVAVKVPVRVPSPGLLPRAIVTGTPATGAAVAPTALTEGAGEIVCPCAVSEGCVTKARLAVPAGVTTIVKGLVAACAGVAESCPWVGKVNVPAAGGGPETPPPPEGHPAR